MTGFGWILATLLSHWRRRPGQLAALIAGLAVAVALWSGVQALNAEARAAYDRAAGTLAGDRLARITAADGAPITLADHAALRGAGWQVSPVLEGRWRPEGASASVTLLGIDPLTLPPAALPGSAGEDARMAGPLQGFVAPPWRLLGAAATLARLEGAADLPATRAVEGLAPGVVLADIALVEQLLGRTGEADRLIVAAAQPPGRPPLAELAGGRLRLQPPGSEPELAGLTNSFHLNLTAFGLLSFVVGLFIVNATIGLAFEQRRPMVRTLRALGLTRGQLAAALFAELSALALLSALIGMALGYALAAMLLPDMAASLRGLYGAELPGRLTLRPGWWAAGAVMALAGTLAAAANGVWRLWRLPVLATAQTEAWRAAQARALRWQGAGAVALALAALALARWGDGLLAGFALMGSVLVGAALALPGALAGLLAVLTRRVRGPVAEWFVAEARAQLGGLSMALMALLLALAVNIGVGAMVESFRATFLGWLDQRLAAELYVRGADEAQAADMAAFLRARDDVAAVLPIQSVETRVADRPVELFGVRDDPLYRENWPLLAAGEGPWDRLLAGTGILVSEQLARRAGLALGDRVAVAGAGPDWRPEIVGTYPDYGNPRGQAIVSAARLTERWPQVTRTRFAVRLAPGGAAPAVLSALEARFDLGPDQAVDQASLKDFSRRIFERTFAVTLALNVLTFAVAGLALFTSLTTLARMRLPQLAPLWALGLTRQRLAALELLRAVLLAALTAVLAVPLGVLVAWILLAVVNVEAFGWRIPLRHYPADWAWLFALATVTAAAAAAIPARRLRRTAPAALLRVFSDAR